MPPINTPAIVSVSPEKLLKAESPKGGVNLTIDV